MPFSNVIAARLAQLLIAVALAGMIYLLLLLHVMKIDEIKMIGEITKKSRQNINLFLIYIS